MRMNTKSEWSARELINEYSAEELQQIFKNYGELRIARKLAEHIVKERNQNPIETTQGLVSLLTPILPKHVFNKIIAQVEDNCRAGKNSYATGKDKKCHQPCFRAPFTGK